MAQPKASTLQQRFGFQDEDLKMQNHDDIMLWLDNYADTITKLIFPQDGNWSKNEVSECQSYYPDKNLGELPEKPPVEIQKKIWEHTVAGKNGFVIGFVDMVVIANTPSLHTSEYRGTVKWSAGYTRNSVLFEVKSVLPSLGELIRQIRLYQQFIQADYRLSNGRKFFVVAPDNKYAKLLNQQGIGFIKYPEGTIFDKG